MRDEVLQCGSDLFTVDCEVDIMLHINGLFSDEDNIDVLRQLR